MALYYPFLAPYENTFVQETFPEHHFPFEHTRKVMAQAVHLPHFSQHNLLCPRVDIRESSSAFYFDLELPGLESKQNIQLSWINDRALLVEAKISRPPIDLSGRDPAETHDQTEAAKLTADRSSAESKIHLTVRERLVGDIGRAFNFPVDVDHETMTARLNFGLLSMVIPKKVRDKNYVKQIPVEHAGN
jgi:HSP20 family molecular chaperone IbpA